MKTVASILSTFICFVFCFGAEAKDQHVFRQANTGIYSEQETIGTSAFLIDDSNPDSHPVAHNLHKVALDKGHYQSAQTGEAAHEFSFCKDYFLCNDISLPGLHYTASCPLFIRYLKLLI